VTKPIHLNAVEGEALRVAELIVGHGRSGMLPPSIELGASPRPELLEAVARTFAASTMTFLLRGGRPPRTVLRGARRRSGRLWDPSLNDGFDLRFSRATHDLWLQLVRTVVPVAHRKRRPSSPEQAAPTRDDRRIVRDASNRNAESTGDFVLLALAHENAAHFGLPQSLEEVLRQGLRRASPLALLFGLDDPTLEKDEVRPRIAALIAPGPMRVLECLDDALCDAWCNRFRYALLHAENLEQFTLRMRGFAFVLQTYADAMDRAHRTDLLRVVARFLAAVPRRGIPQGLDVRNHCLRIPGVTSMADRDNALGAILAVLDVRVAVDELRRRLMNERYGDDRYEEAQVVLRMIEEELDPHRAGLDELARAVSGVVG
jgi:hypothetical protein